MPETARYSTVSLRDVIRAVGVPQCDSDGTSIGHLMTSAGSSPTNAKVDEPTVTNLTRRRMCTPAEINHMVLRGCLDEAEAKIANMSELGQNLPLKTWHSLMHAFTKAGRTTQVDQYMVYMTTIKAPVNAVTFNLVLNACAVAHDVARAEHWWQQMQEYGIQPTVVTFGTLCKVSAYEGDVTSIKSMMDFAEFSGAKVAEHFYASLIIAYGKRQPQGYAQAVDVLKTMHARNLSVQKVRRVFVESFGETSACAAFSTVCCRGPSAASSVQHASQLNLGSGI